MTVSSHLVPLANNCPRLRLRSVALPCCQLNDVSLPMKIRALPWHDRLLNIQLLRFLVVGCMNTGFSYSIYAFLLYVGVDYRLASLGSFLLGILFSFRTQGALVFRNAERSRFTRYLSVWLSLYLVNIGLIAMIMRFGVTSYWAGALALLPVVAASYALQRFYVFRV